MTVKLFSLGDGDKIYAKSVNDAHDTVGGRKKDIELIAKSSIGVASCDRSRVGIILSNRIETAVREFEQDL